MSKVYNEFNAMAKAIKAIDDDISGANYTHEVVEAVIAVLVAVEKRVKALEDDRKRN